MEGRINKILNSDRHRRARSESNLQGLALQILDHLSSNNQAAARATGGHPQPAARATGGHPSPAARACRSHHQPGHRAGGGRTIRNTSSRPTGTSRSVSFSSICACPGPGCSSGPEVQHPPAYSELNPAAPSFRPAHPQSRNTARRSRIPGGPSTNLCRPTLSYPDPRNLTVLAPTQPRETVILDTGLTAPVLLLPPDHFVASGKASDCTRSTASPPTRACSSPAPTRASPTRASPARPTSLAPVSSPPARCHSPIIEPDTSHIGLEETTKAKKQIELGFRVNIAEHLSYKEAARQIDKSYDYTCSCLNRKSLCTCEEAVLEVSLRVKYHLFKTV
jgi:hypothetical protein